MQFFTWRKRDVLIISISHNFEPYYLKSKGLENGVFIRLGSTNRIADMHTITEIQRLRGQKYFDEQPNIQSSIKDIDFDLAKELFFKVGKKFAEQTAQSLGIIVQYHAKLLPSNAGILLFSPNFKLYFPDAIIRLGRFAGIDKSEIIDHLDLEAPISIVIDQIIAFIRRHTITAAQISSIRREDIPEYPPVAIREIITNALLHADYSIKGVHIQIAIFSDRLEVTNPGALPFGLNLETALSGISQLRNRTIGRVFRELQLIEQWGSGLSRVIAACLAQKLPPPKFEELGNFFRVTLYQKLTKIMAMPDWYVLFINYIQKHNEITAKLAQEIWKVSPRTASNRLKKLIDQGLIVELSTSPYDPKKSFRLAQVF